MQFSTASVMTLVLGLGLSVHGYILPRALNKANEYPEEKCLAKNGSNKPTWAHTPSLCACVSLDKTDVSAYLVAMSGQRMLAYSNQNCNPGINGEDGLGDIGGGCAELDTHFAEGRIGSVYWYTPAICEIGEAILDGFEAFVTDATKMAIDGIIEVPK
ncbi:hypothetical protein BCIN_05g02690 [Botrytis cinerea B05.10]|uniref:Small secreted protein n=3 Tax=Botryotinia fuckeliana TaxID=40559 RepID=A0A384JH02_BOTFB|nr:hypothetical protein BCIN_05g02690 [Botrytis cinerea B05.10]ATZ49869.1 hypothetical protein BCIN_05g02690 [Botrytis cinerea B05.10]EMR89454.1 hypothetical protein BcDW1_1912 [Botrytis cinerea BcDW1]CCD46664.1 hypothetical protein BofuT4_P042750.1 [Botrytis cinerea T4]